MKNVLPLILAPLALLNAFGGAIGFIWLVVIGEWRLALMLLAASFFGHFLLSIGMMPGMGIGAVTSMARFSLLSYVGSYISVLWCAAIIGAWCYFVFSASIGHATEANHIPLLLSSYGTAIGPIAYIASKETNNILLGSLATATMVAYIAALLMLVAGAGGDQISTVFVCIMGAATFFIFFLIKPQLDALRREQMVQA